MAQTKGEVTVMLDKTNKSKATPTNDAQPHLVTLVIVLSEDEQINAAKQKAAEFSAAQPDKMVAIGKPSSTKDGLRVEFGVMR